MQKNHWCLRKDTIAYWQLEFPPPSDYKAIKNFTEFTKLMLHAGIESELFRIDELQYGQTINTNISPEHYINTVQKAEQPYKTDLAIDAEVQVAPFRQLDCLVNLCYFDTKGYIASGYFKEIGSLLAKLRPDAYNSTEFSRQLFNYLPPFSIWSDFRIEQFDSNYASWQPVKIVCTAFSNIWFPYVRSFLESEAVPIDQWPPNFLSNYTLAKWHTPALNQFLSKLKEHCLAYKGIWSYGLDASHRYYADVLESDGIRIIDQLPNE